jgi:hypothetical protein
MDYRMNLKKVKMMIWILAKKDSTWIRILKVKLKKRNSKEMKRMKIKKNRMIQKWMKV